MKVEFQDGQYGFGMTLTPETPKEVAQLLRLSNNKKKQEPDIIFQFNNDVPYCSVWLKKLSPMKSQNYISK